MKIKNSQKFIKVFKKIEKYLENKNKSSGYVRFENLLQNLSSREPVIEHFTNELRDFGYLRNAIQHPNGSEYLAEVLPKTVSKIQKIYKTIINPPTVFDKFQKDVYFCTTEDNLLDVIKIMANKTYTHIPVYKKNKFWGILTEARITNWLGKEFKQEKKNLREIKVGDLGNYLHQHPNEAYKFINKNTDVYKVKKWFTEFIDNNKRLGVIFITKTGRKDEKLLGIITAWDLPRIDDDKRRIQKNIK